MKKFLTAASAAALLGFAGIASAAEPVQLTDSQMDAVSAGQSSVATSGGFAGFGTVASGADTNAYVRYRCGTVTKYTAASAATISSGVVVGATASAGSHL